MSGFEAGTPVSVVTAQMWVSRGTTDMTSHMPEDFGTKLRRSDHVGSQVALALTVNLCYVWVPFPKIGRRNIVRENNPVTRTKYRCPSVWEIVIVASIASAGVISLHSFNETGSLFSLYRPWVGVLPALLIVLGWRLRHRWPRTAMIVGTVSLTLLAWVVAASILGDTAKLYTGDPWMAVPSALLAVLGWGFRRHKWALALGLISTALAVWFVAEIDLIADSDTFIWMLLYALAFIGIYAEARRKRQRRSVAAR